MHSQGYFSGESFQVLFFVKLVIVNPSSTEATFIQYIRMQTFENPVMLVFIE